MVVFGLDLSCPLIRALVALLVVGFVTVVSLLKFYVYITCAYHRKLDKMEGKTVIITGGNGGIGRETAKEIAKRGARVILACRNLETATKIRDDLIKETKNRDIVVKKLDLTSQKSIREFAEDVNRSENRLDVLLHNAGTVATKIQITEDNLESTMATNHYGSFLLTHLLIDLLKRSAPSRIVVVASELYRLASLNPIPSDVNPTRSWFTPYLYYKSKYANILFTRELACRLRGSGVTANCLHPGLVDTGIWESVPTVVKWPFKLVVRTFFKTPVQGCQTSVFLACADEISGVTGRYFAECKEKGLNSGASDDNKARKLWEVSESLVNLRVTDPKV